MSESTTQTPIEIHHAPSNDTLRSFGVKNWPVWTKEVSEFPWTYAESETCYFTEGEVVVTPDGGEPIAMGKGDLVTFSSGLSCTWNIRQPVRKHYNFG